MMAITKFCRTAGATAALWFTFIEARKSLELCFSWNCYGPRCGQRLRKGLIDIGYKSMLFKYKAVLIFVQLFACLLINLLAPEFGI
jgi:hypothetical protein